MEQGRILAVMHVALHPLIRLLCCCISVVCNVCQSGVCNVCIRVESVMCVSVCMCMYDGTCGLPVIFSH